MGLSSGDRGFAAEISPLGPSVNGASISNYVIQPEYNGTEWNDVLRVQISDSQPPTDVNIRVYSVETREVPEPMSVVLFGVGLAMLTKTRTRRKN